MSTGLSQYEKRVEFWRLARVKAETGLSTSAIYRDMAAGSFPKNFAISKQARAWASDEVEAWKASRLAARRNKNAGKS